MSDSLWPHGLHSPWNSPARTLGWVTGEMANDPWTGEGLREPKSSAQYHIAGGGWIRESTPCPPQRLPSLPPPNLVAPHHSQGLRRSCRPLVGKKSHLEKDVTFPMCCERLSEDEGCYRKVRGGYLWLWRVRQSSVRQCWNGTLAAGLSGPSSHWYTTTYKTWQRPEFRLA